MAKPPIRGAAPKRQRKPKAVKATVVKAPPERAYHTSFPRVVYNLAFRGDTDADICGVLGVSESTFYRWLNLHDGLRENLDQGRVDGGVGADAAVETALHARAVGYVAKDQVVKFVPLKDEKGKPTGEFKTIVAEVDRIYPPDVGAAEFWLSNRQGHRWKRRVEHQLDVNLQVRRALLDLPDE